MLDSALSVRVSDVWPAPRAGLYTRVKDLCARKRASLLVLVRASRWWPWCALPWREVLHLAQRGGAPDPGQHLGLSDDVDISHGLNLVQEGFECLKSPLVEKVEPRRVSIQAKWSPVPMVVCEEVIK